MNIFQSNLRLKPSILTSFVLLTVPRLFSPSSPSRTCRTTALPGPMRRNWSSASASTPSRTSRPISIPSSRWSARPRRSATSIPDFYLDERCFTYFHSVLLHSPRIVSVYVGLNDGAFRQSPAHRSHGQDPGQAAARRRGLRLPLDRAQAGRAAARPLSLPYRRPEAVGRERPGDDLRSADAPGGTGSASEAAPRRSPIPTSSRRSA